MNVTVDEMVAGRELDAEIGRRIFDMKVFKPSEVCNRPGDFWAGTDDYHYIPSGKPPRTHMIDARPVPRFSEDIAAAWEVIDKLRSLDYHIQIEAHGDFTCEVWSDDGGHREAWYLVADADAEAAPLAICRAALKVMDARRTSE